MKKILLTALILPALAFAQTYPSPTFNTITLQNPLSPANGGTGSTASTGTGSTVLSNSPTLVTPALGTPSSITLTNGTGLPASTGISGLGTGVATALGAAVSGSGSIVLGTSPTIASPTVTGAFIATGLVTTADIAIQAANTVVANVTGSSASPTAFAMPSCSSSTSSLQWTSGTGFTCYANSASLTGATFSGAISAPGVTTSANFLGSGTGYSIGNTTGLSSGSALQLFDATHGNNFSVLIGGSQVANFTSTGINNAAVGQSTPLAGSFTTLTANSTVSGTGFTSLLSPYAPLASPTFTGTPAAPTATLGTNTTQIATMAAVAAHGGCANLIDYGGDPTNTNSNNTALTNALAAATITGQVCVYIPPGNFKFSAGFSYTHPNSTASVSIIGAGPNITNLIWPAGGGLQVDYLGQFNAAHIRHLSILTGTTATGNGILLQQGAASIANPANSALSDITDVTIRGSDGYAATDYWNTGINISGVSNVNIMGVMIVGNNGATPAGTGISVGGTSSLPPVVFNITASTFNNLNVGFNYGNYVQGVTLSQNNFTFDQTSIFVASSLTNLDQLTIVGNQFGPPASGVTIGINTWVPFTLIADNLFFVNGTGSGIAMITGLTTVTGNSFHGDAGGNCNGFIGTSTNSTNASIITGNVFNGLSLGIGLNSGTKDVNVQSNAYSGNTTNVSNSGTGNTIGGGSQ